MPIKNLTEMRRLPRLGHLRLGIKKKSARTGKEHPAEVDYFILDPKTPDAKRNTTLKKEFAKLYGAKPKTIKIMFPPASPEVFFSQWYKRYGKSTLVKCKGDGEVATCVLPEFAEGLTRIGETDQGMIKVRCDGTECPFYKDNQCNRMATLQVILPEISGIGVWQINTSSWNSIVNMNSAVDWLKGLCGRYYMIPIILMRVETEIQYEGKKSKHYILQIDQNISLMDIQKMALKPAEMIALSAPDEEKDDLFYDGKGKPGKPIVDMPQAVSEQEKQPQQKKQQKPKQQPQPEKIEEPVFEDTEEPAKEHQATMLEIRGHAYKKELKRLTGKDDTYYKIIGALGYEHIAQMDNVTQAEFVTQLSRKMKEIQNAGKRRKK